MVRGHVCSRCEECGEEFLTRNEVERILYGVDVMRYPRNTMKRACYRDAHVFTRVLFGGISGSYGVTEHVVCGCTVDRALSAEQLILRPEYREAVIAKFGPVLSAPLLFKLPREFVAWENSAYVCAQNTEHGMIIASEGIPLIDIVVDMSSVGALEGYIPLFSAQQVLGGFSYLTGVEASMRSFAAMDFGPHAQVDDVLLKFPPAEDPATEDVSAGGNVEVYAVHEPYVSHDPVCADMLAEQMVDCVYVNVQQYLAESYDVAQVIESTTVELFAADGVVEGDDVAVAFDPGTSLVIDNSVRVHSELTPIVVLLSGRVRLRVEPVTLGKRERLRVACMSFAGGGGYATRLLNLLPLLSVEARVKTTAVGVECRCSPKQSPYLHVSDVSMIVADNTCTIQYLSGDLMPKAHFSFPISAALLRNNMRNFAGSADELIAYRMAATFPQFGHVGALREGKVELGTSGQSDIVVITASLASQFAGFSTSSARVCGPWWFSVPASTSFSQAEFRLFAGFWQHWARLQDVSAHDLLLWRHAKVLSPERERLSIPGLGGGTMQLKTVGEGSGGANCLALGDGYCYLGLLAYGSWWHLAQLLGQCPRVKAVALAYRVYGRTKVKSFALVSTAPGVYHVQYVTGTCAGTMSYRQVYKSLTALARHEPNARLGLNLTDNAVTRGYDHMVESHVAVALSIASIVLSIVSIVLRVGMRR